MSHVPTYNLITSYLFVFRTFILYFLQSDPRQHFRLSVPFNRGKRAGIEHLHHAKLLFCQSAFLNQEADHIAFADFVSLSAINTQRNPLRTFRPTRFCWKACW